MSDSQSVIHGALEYAASLINIPYRWYVEDTDTLDGSDKFWSENGPPPTYADIVKHDKSIVCTGLTNLMRRKCGLSIPGLDGNITGKYSELYRHKYPGGTGAWFLYLYQRKRLQKLDVTKTYPRGTLLLAKYIDAEENQGHVAVVYDTDDHDGPLVIHAGPDILFAHREKYKNHGAVKIEAFHLLKSNVFTHVCLPEHWLLQE
jgi:hypothetical protein